MSKPEASNPDTDGFRYRARNRQFSHCSDCKDARGPSLLAEAVFSYAAIRKGNAPIGQADPECHSPD
jgi:hypothetical protein